MICNFTKSLDRPLELFGIKGKWLILLLAIAGAGAFAGIFVGMIIDTTIGVLVFVSSIFAGFLFVRASQDKASHRQLGKLSLVNKVTPYVYRRETIKSIMYVDPRFKEKQDNLLSR